LQQKYPNINVQRLYDADTSQGKKFSDWMCREVNKGGDPRDVIPTANLFARFQRNLKKKDINQYVAKELEDEIKDIQALGADQELSKKAQKKLIKVSGADKIYEDENVVVLNIATPKTAKFYGSGTRWCITNRESFEEYTNEGQQLYFILNKKLKKEDPLYKICVHVEINDPGVVTFSIGLIANAEDKTISKNAVNRDLLSKILADAKIRPETLTSKFNSRKNLSESEWISLWRECENLRDKILLYGRASSEVDVIEKIAKNDPDLKKIFDEGGKISDKVTYLEINPYKEQLTSKHIYSDDYAIYYGEENKPNRINGPAVITVNLDTAEYEYWCIEGIIHRDDGPALIAHYQGWYYHGNRVGDDYDKRSGDVYDENKPKKVTEFHRNMINLPRNNPDGQAYRKWCETSGFLPKLAR
jgi:hypothetical protein